MLDRILEYRINDKLIKFNGKAQTIRTIEEFINGEKVNWRIYLSNENFKDYFTVVKDIEIVANFNTLNEAMNYIFDEIRGE